MKQFAHSSLIFCSNEAVLAQIEQFNSNKAKVQLKLKCQASLSLILLHLYVAKLFTLYNIYY